MIMLCGIPSEPPIAMVAAALDTLGVDYRIVNQRKVADFDFAWRIDAGTVKGTLRLDAETLRLEEIGGTYVRLMDDRLLPELADEADGSLARRHARAFHDALLRWLEVAPGRIVNRSDPQGSNGSKPYQAQLIMHYGLRVPETLITNDPDAVLAFQHEHGTLIYKSMSGVRSIVHALSQDDIARLDLIRWCPVQFQALVPGTDMRVHVVDREVHATEIVSDRLDYRYARRSGGSAELRAAELKSDIAEKCVALTRGLGLAFAGIDLKITPDGEVFCFEVNPCPAFSFYEANTGQPIARALARYLAGGG
jgi:glutathione synthase/RimK-type ligase-like ATP-grasp enzyme